MSKGLEALKQMSYYHLEMGNCIRDLPNYAIIEKSLKALEIIKEKRVNVNDLVFCRDLDTYNFNAKHFYIYSVELTQEEFDLLKEMLL